MDDNMSAAAIEASIHAPLGSSILEDDTQIIQRDGWYQILTPSVQNEVLNEVIISRIDKSEVDNAIKETLAVYRKYRVPFKWLTGPMSHHTIEQRIASLATTSWVFRGMAVDTKVTISAPTNLSIQRVDSKNFDEFLNVFLSGWGFLSKEDRERAVKKAELITSPKSIFTYYIAKIDDLPIGSAGYVLKDSYAYLVGGNILEKYRGRGAYKALVKKRLADLHAAGFNLAVTQAREATSVPILAKLGFSTTFKGTVYRFSGESL